MGASDAYLHLKGFLPVIPLIFSVYLIVIFADTFWLELAGFSYLIASVFLLILSAITIYFSIKYHKTEKKNHKANYFTLIALTSFMLIIFLHLTTSSKRMEFTSRLNTMLTYKKSSFRRIFESMYPTPILQQYYVYKRTIEAHDVTTMTLALWIILTYLVLFKGATIESLLGGDILPHALFSNIPKSSQEQLENNLVPDDPIPIPIPNSSIQDDKEGSTQPTNEQENEEPKPDVAKPKEEPSIEITIPQPIQQDAFQSGNETDELPLPKEEKSAPELQPRKRIRNQRPGQETEAKQTQQPKPKPKLNTNLEFSSSSDEKNTVDGLEFTDSGSGKKKDDEGLDFTSGSDDEPKATRGLQFASSSDDEKKDNNELMFTSGDDDKGKGGFDGLELASTDTGGKEQLNGAGFLEFESSTATKDSMLEFADSTTDAGKGVDELEFTDSILVDAPKKNGGNMNIEFESTSKPGDSFLDFDDSDY